MDFYPTWRAGDVLTVILGPPSLHEAHPYSTHLGEIEHSSVSVVNALRQQLGELLVVEDLERAVGWDLADCGVVEAVVMVAVARLHEDSRIREALGINLATNVVKMHSCSRQIPVG